MGWMSHMRHRHRIDHHVLIDDRDRECVDAQSGYSVHATARDVVTPVTACAKDAQAVDQADRERRSAKNAGVFERVHFAVDVEDRNGSSHYRHRHGSPRSNVVYRRDGDELVHAPARLFWLQLRAAFHAPRRVDADVSMRLRRRSCPCERSQSCQFSTEYPGKRAPTRGCQWLLGSSGSIDRRIDISRQRRCPGAFAADSA